MRHSVDQLSRDLLARYGAAADEAIDLAEAALALAALTHHPAEGARAQDAEHLADYRDHLQEICRDVSEVVGGRDAPALAECAHALSAVLADRHGYRGDEETYDDLANANLMRVIDRRRGLPVSLGILYLHAARAQGWAAEGLNFPGHFLIRLEAAGDRVILDPFNAGQVRTTADLRDILKVMSGAEAELKPDHYAPVGNRAILLRLEGNIKLRHLQADAIEQALEVVERMVLFAPDEAHLWREAGLLNAQLGRLKAARGNLERYIDMEPLPEVRERWVGYLRQLGDKLH